MTGVAIYLEGGGDSTAQKAALRRGMDGFLAAVKAMATARQLRWRVVACGGRDTAHDAFTHAAATDPATFSVLFVDSEDEVTSTPVQHLRTRDGWGLAGVHEDRVHLMVRAMESWLVADPQQLAEYYGQQFHAGALPAAVNLETVPKADVQAALQAATRDTQKGPYQKIRHGADLLLRIDPDRVQRRCPHCRRLFERLAAVLEHPGRFVAG